MAKMGEGDARWIVAERKDGANCNSWHWEEKPIEKQTHAALKECLKGLELTSDSGNGLSVSVKEVSEIDGDVTVAQRKQKIMCYFELKMTIKYTGKDSSADDEVVEGKIDIPDVDHDTFRDTDYAMTVAASSTGTAQNKARVWVHANGRAIIRKKIVDFFEQLFIDNHVGKNSKTGQPMGSPAGSAQAAAATSAAAASSPAAAPKKIVTSAATTTTTASSSSSSSGSTTSFDQVFIWRVPPQELWGVLTDQGRASAYTRAPAKIDPRPTGAFEFMGGAMSGYYVEVEHPKKLTMQWRLSSWASGVFSTVVLNLSQEEVGVTRLEFAQVGIPSGEMERVKSGWMCNFWDPIKMVFGFQYELK